MKRIMLLTIAALLAATTVLAQKTLGDGVKDLATQISASTTKEQKQRIAVLPFRELDGPPTVLGTFIAEELVTHLVNSGLKVVERAQLDKLLGEQRLQQSGTIDPATAKEVGRVAGVDAIVTGSITDLQSIVGINARLIDTTTGEVFAAAQTKITKDDDVKKIMSAPLAQSAATAAAPARSTASNKIPSYTRDWFRLTVESLRKSEQTVVVTAFVENTGEQNQSVGMNEFFLLDENGERWDQSGPDTAHFTTCCGVQVPAQTRRKTTITFTTKGDPSGTRFTLSEQNSSVSIRGLLTTR